jgi:hypothetical protein
MRQEKKMLILPAVLQKAFILCFASVSLRFWKTMVMGEVLPDNERKECASKSLVAFNIFDV